ncbi:MAG TPA: DUF1329 domain-containing protein [Candidatus Binataceae bacterium]|jgi:hypothetical protein|nr:DUF1329 domain-containing protein [Candidatus Binataceae bacterium]
MSRVGEILIGVLLGTFLVAWFSSSALAQVEQVPWDNKSYDQLLPADSPDTIPPGTKINMQNWQNYKKFMPVGLWVMWGGSQFYKLPPETELQVVANQSIPLPKKYLQDTEKYASQVSLVPNSFGGLSPKGYVAGLPFPNPSGPNTGMEIVYNEYYAYVPHVITTYADHGFSMDQFGNKSISEVREVNFKVKHLSDPGQPINIPSLGDVFLTYNNIVMVPEQSKYTNDLVIFYDDPATLGETFVFVPSLRRSLRLSSAARCAPLVGSDYTADDERSMSIQPPIFDAKFLGYKKLLVMYPTAGYTEKANYYQPIWFASPKAAAWMLRTVALVDVRRTEKTRQGYCYGSRMAYIDKETWQPIWMDLYDINLKLWKTGPSMYKPMPLPNTGGDVATGGGGPGDGMYNFWDMQNHHLSFDIQLNALINENVPPLYQDFQRWGTPAGMLQVMQ